MPLEAIIVIIVVMATIVNIMVMVIRDIMATNINSIRENIMDTIATSRDDITPGVMGLITIEIAGIIRMVIIRAISIFVNLYSSQYGFRQ